MLAIGQQYIQHLTAQLATFLLPVTGLFRARAAGVAFTAVTRTPRGRAAICCFRMPQVHARYHVTTNPVLTTRAQQ